MEHKEGGMEMNEDINTQLRISKIQQLEDEIEKLRDFINYHKALNSCYAADRQAMMAEHGPDYAARKFPRVTKFLNEKEGKGE